MSVGGRSVAVGRGVSDRHEQPVPEPVPVPPAIEEAASSVLEPAAPVGFGLGCVGACGRQEDHDFLRAWLAARPGAMQRAPGSQPAGLKGLPGELAFDRREREC